MRNESAAPGWYWMPAARPIRRRARAPSYGASVIVHVLGANDRTVQVGSRSIAGATRMRSGEAEGQSAGSGPWINATANHL